MSKKRLVGMILALFMVFSIPTVGFAINDEQNDINDNEVSIVENAEIVKEVEKLGSVEFDSKLDVGEVIQIAFIGEQELNVYGEPNNENDALATLEPKTVLYVYEIEKVEKNNTIVEWLKVKVDDSEIFYFIERDLIAYVSEDSGYAWTPPVVYSGGGGSSGGSGGGSGSFKITYYCSACNSPRGSGQTSSGQQAYVGSVACNNFPNGTTIYVEGYGTYVVLDKMGRSGVIDIFRGYFDHCSCSGTGRANAWAV